MEKVRIVITIDHVIRNLYGRIVELYTKHYIELPKEQAMIEGYDFESPELNLPIKSHNLCDHIPFDDEEHMLDFIFSEFPLEIFGHAKESEQKSMMMLNEWIEDHPQFEIRLVSNEVERTKPSTLFFLSKIGCQVDNITFIDDNVDIWNYCDILITSSEPKNPKPECKKLILVQKPFNKGVKANIVLRSFVDLFDIERIKPDTFKIKKPNCVIKFIKKIIKK